METSSRGKSEVESTEGQSVPHTEENRNGPDSAFDESAGETVHADGFSTHSAQSIAEPARTPARLEPISRGQRAASARTLLSRLPSVAVDERIGRLLLSIVLAVLLWFYVVSLENPEQTASFKGLSVELRGVGTNLKATSVQPGTVDVTVHAPQNVINGFTQADVHPYSDLTGLGAGVHDVPVRADLDPGVANSVQTDFSPRALQVQLELQATHVYSVEVRTTGTPAFGYALEPPQVSPAQVQVSGSQEVLSRVQRVVVPVDVTATSATYQGLKAPIASDADGKEVSGLTFTPPNVQVVVPVKLLLNYKPVPVHVPVEGQPAPGYRVSAITIDPTNITVCCSPSVIEPLKQLDTRPVSITGTTSTVVTTTNLILPPNVELYPGQRQVVSVTVSVEPMQTTLQLSVAPTVDSLSPDLTAVVSPDRLEMTLSGTFEQLQSLTPTDVRAAVNVSGLGPGTYQLKPQISVPQGVKIESTSGDTVTVTLIAPTPVPPTPTRTATPVAPTSTPPQAVTATPVPGAAGTPLPTATTPSTPVALPTPSQPATPTPPGGPASRGLTSPEAGPSPTPGA